MEKPVLAPIGNGRDWFEPGHADAVGLPFPDRVDDLEAPVGDRGGGLVALCAIGVGVYFLVDALNKEPKQAAPPPAPKIVVHTKKDSPRPRRTSASLSSRPRTRRASPAPTRWRAPRASRSPPSPRPAGSRAPTRSRSSTRRLAVRDRRREPHRATRQRADPAVHRQEHPDPHAGRADGARPRRARRRPRAHQVFRIGAAASPSGVDVQHVTGKDPAAIAAAIDVLRQKLTGAKPDDVLLVSSYRARSTRCPLLLGGPIRRPRALREQGLGAEAHDRGAQAGQGRVPSTRSGRPRRSLTRRSRTPAASTSNVVRIGDRTRSRTRSPSRATRTAASAGTSTIPGTAS